MGFAPRFSAVSRSISTTAAAPSLMPDALPAVTVPSLRNTGRSFARSSTVASARGCSSVSNTVSPRRVFILTGRICCLNRPSDIARDARRCDSSASASWSPRVIWWLSARFSAVSPMWMLSNGSCSAASIMSTIAASPMRAPQRTPCARYGARLMLSAPPPTAMSVSPSMMVCAADTIACRPEPHSRFSVNAGVSFATPAFIAATRARYMSFGSVWITLPNTT